MCVDFYKFKMIKYITIITFLSLVSFLPVHGQNDTIDLHKILNVSRTKLFESEEPIEITLRFDITEFRKSKFKKENQDAIMTYYLNGKDTVSRNIKLRSRGNFRLQYCDFPPIRLNLDKEDLPGDEFNEIDKIKLVTHCKVGGGDYVLREYLVYKLFNVLTDQSFKVRLVKIKYINSRKPDKPDIEEAFLIEPTEFLSKRLNSTEITPERFSQKFVKPEVMDRVAVFNYMIGNYDWSVPVLHNLAAFSPRNFEYPNLGLVVPYDFDYSGIVNTSYAVPPETLPIKTVRERLYLGICRSEEDFRKTLNVFLEKKQEFYKVINEFPYLKKSSKKEMTAYLDTFYAEFGKRNNLVYKILSECQDF
jgi:hypothetical protein